MFRFCVFLMWSIVSVQFYAVSQIIKPIKWEFEIDSSDYSTNKKNYLVFKPTIELGWYLYSSDNDPNSGPYTIFEFNKNETYKLNNSIIALNVKTKYDSVWNSEVRYLDKGGFFKQEFTPVLEDISISGIISYQVCSEIEKMCIPLETEFSFYSQSNQEKIVSEKITNNNFGQNESLISFILFSFFAGFLAILTPCVFPMIPITVSYFIHQGEVGERKPLSNAIIYTLGIIATFSILGFILALTLGASGANQLAANPWVNLFIAALFIYFALSLFGMYEIEMPAKLKELSMSQEGRGGIIGTLFMAVTFTLTSFTCTVQFVGLLLVSASQGQWFWPFLGMVVFSAAFAFPFFFLALFPQYLAKLPKSGGWLNSVKVVMGFLEMAAAFKFLSNTDLVWGWGFFSHNAVLAVWAVLMLLTGFYLLGKIQLPHDSPLKLISVPRLMLSTAFLTFGLYLTSGLFGQRIHLSLIHI